MERESRPEGPFGERTGYYATGVRNEPVVKVSRVMHRNDPIIQGDPPLKPVPGMDHFGIPLPAAAVWSALEYAGVQDVRGGVWLHGPFATVISLKQRYEGHARQAAAIASGVGATLGMGRFVILVDEDIDPSDLRDVFWAMTSRCDPATQTQIMHDFPTSDINPRVAPEDRDAGRFVASRIVIDAGRRGSKEFPATNVMSQEKKRNSHEVAWRGSINSLASAGAQRDEIETNQLAAKLPAHGLPAAFIERAKLCSGAARCPAYPRSRERRQAGLVDDDESRFEPTDTGALRKKISV